MVDLLSTLIELGHFKVDYISEVNPSWLRKLVKFNRLTMQLQFEGFKF